MKNNTIFFLTIPLYGHVFPVLDVINKIGKEGYNTYCFVNDFFAEYIKNDNVSVICYPEKVIANFNTKSSNLLEDEHISYYHLNYTSNNIEWSAISSKYLYEYMYDYMMKYVKKYNPQVIIYDSLAKWGGLLAKKFNIHSIAIEVATDIEEANCFYEKFYNENPYYIGQTPLPFNLLEKILIFIIISIIVILITKFLVKKINKFVERII